MKRVCSGDGMVLKSVTEEVSVEPVGTSSPNTDESFGVLSRIQASMPQLPRALTREVFWTNALNPGPTISVMVSMMLVFGAASWFVEKYVLTALSSFAVFALGSYVVFTSYFTFHYYFSRFSTSYRRIDPDKQFYVLSNLIKSAMLMTFTPQSIYVLYEIFFDRWNNQRIHNMGCLYAIPDFVSLLLVRKMATTTIVHHLVVCLFNVLSVYNDYNNENVCRPIVIYAIFSTFSYLVNFLLASRFLDVGDKLRIILSSLSCFIYITCCAINWSWQVMYVIRLVSVGQGLIMAVYCAAITLIIWDDLTLIRYLLFDIRRRLAKVSKAE